MGASHINMKCKLCEKDKKLIKAHIIPKAFFRALRVGDKPAPLVDVSPSADADVKRSPIGVYDMDLVCSGCESLFGDWDAYGQSVILNIDERVELKNDGKIVADIVKNYDYDKLKLFFISLLWRASASQEKYYSQVELGLFENICKEMLLANNPGTDDEFSVVIARYPNPAGSVIIEPQRAKWNGINWYLFYLSGHIAYIKVDKRNALEPMAGLMLKRDKFLFIAHKDIYKSPEAELIAKAMKKVNERSK